MRRVQVNVTKCRRFRKALFIVGATFTFLVAVTFNANLSAAATPATGKHTGSSTGKKAAWEVEWDKTLVAARREGKLTIDLGGGAGRQYRPPIQHFAKKFNLSVEIATGDSGQMIDRLLAERNVGRYGVDVGFVARTQGVGRLIPAGALAPIAEVFFLPEVLDTSLWLGGRHSYADPEGKYLFTYAVRSTVAASDIYFNTKLISVKEMAAIRSIWDFVDPSRFKSKIVFFYLPPARGVVPLTEIMHPDIGEKWIRRLFARELDVFFTDNARVMVDNVARGKRPLGMGMGAVRRQFNEVADAGAPLELWSNILPEPSKERPVLGNPATSHNFSLVDRAPHPNAAKLFINWWLTKEGQTIRQTLSTSDTDPTLRTDVTEFKMVPKGTRLISGANYIPADSPYFTKDVPIWEARVAKIWEEVRK